MTCPSHRTGRWKVYLTPGTILCKINVHILEIFIDIGNRHVMCHPHKTGRNDKKRWWSCFWSLRAIHELGDVCLVAVLIGNKEQKLWSHMEQVVVKVISGFREEKSCRYHYSEWGWETGKHKNASSQRALSSRFAMKERACSTSSSTGSGTAWGCSHLKVIFLGATCISVVQCMHLWRARIAYPWRNGSTGHHGVWTQPDNRMREGATVNLGNGDPLC